MEASCKHRQARVSFGRNASVRDVAIALVRACGGTDALCPIAYGHRRLGNRRTGRRRRDWPCRCRAEPVCGVVRIRASFQDGVPQLLSRGRAPARSAIYCLTIPA